MHKRSGERATEDGRRQMGKEEERGVRKSRNKEQIKNERVAGNQEMLKTILESIKRREKEERRTEQEVQLKRTDLLPAFFFLLKPTITRLTAVKD